MKAITRSFCILIDEETDGLVSWIKKNAFNTLSKSFDTQSTPELYIKALETAPPLTGKSEAITDITSQL